MSKRETIPEPTLEQGKAMIATMTAVHPFEESGLGKAPYMYVDLATIAAGMSCDTSLMGRNGNNACDHCATIIKDHYYVMSADQKLFSVGCACIDKVTATGKCKLPEDVKKVKAAKAKARIERAKETVQIDAVRANLKSKPHPMIWARDAGLTLLEFADWMLANAGTKGKTDAAFYIERAAKEAGI